MWIRVFTLVAALLALSPEAAVGETPQAPSATPAELPQGASAAAAPAMPHPNQLLVFIRSTLLAVNHANLTGNYTVLRDLGTAAFQRSNSAADLSEIFGDLRRRNIDIGPVAVLDPKLVREPMINEDGRLRLSGFFPSQPEQVNFDLAFELVGDRWRLHGIALNTTPVDKPVAATGAEPQPASPAAADKKTRAAPAPKAASRGTPDPNRLAPSTGQAGTAKQAPAKPAGSFNPFGR